MRKALLIVNLLVAVFSAALLTVAFTGQGYVERLAKAFVVDHTVRYADPFVTASDKLLANPSARHWLTEDEIRAARAEVDSYRRDPHGYVADLMAAEPTPPTTRHSPATKVADPAARLLKERILYWKDGVRQYVRHVITRLLWDLRIFAGSNLAAAALAAWCAWRATGNDRARWLLGVSALLLASTLYGAFMYVDSFTYFRILFAAHPSWRYPLLLAVTFLCLYARYGRRQAQPARPPPPPPSLHV